MRAQHGAARHSVAQHSTAHLFEQGLHEHQPDPLSQLLSHEGEAVGLQSAAHQSSSPDRTKDNAPGLDHTLHLGVKTPRTLDRASAKAGMMTPSPAELALPTMAQGHSGLFIPSRRMKPAFTCADLNRYRTAQVPPIKNIPGKAFKPAGMHINRPTLFQRLQAAVDGLNQQQQQQHLDDLLT
ncbi:MAG: hypothetical protein FRX49_10655 [Trebouxia sp. A1-2]|nr:MAG: hypothetical protein FRX49_10655 [Trebouxia sp. A1-2]